MSSQNYFHLLVEEHSFCVEVRGIRRHFPTDSSWCELRQVSSLVEGNWKFSESLCLNGADKTGVFIASTIYQGTENAWWFKQDEKSKSNLCSFKCVPVVDIHYCWPQPDSQCFLFSVQNFSRWSFLDLWVSLHSPYTFIYSLRNLEAMATHMYYIQLWNLNTAHTVSITLLIKSNIKSVA